MLMAEQFQNSPLFPLHSEDLCVLDFVMLRTYVPARKFERIRKLPRKPNFAHYFRDARIKRGLSVTEVAEQVGVSTASIYFWETDQVRPRDANLSALCKVLKLPDKSGTGDGCGIISVELRAGGDLIPSTGNARRCPW